MGGHLFGYGGYGGNLGGNSWSSGAPTLDERGAGTGWMLHRGSESFSQGHPWELNFRSAEVLQYRSIYLSIYLMNSHYVYIYICMRMLYAYFYISI